MDYRYSAYHAKNPEWIADTTHPESEEWTGTRSTYISAVKATQVGGGTSCSFRACHFL